MKTVLIFGASTVNGVGGKRGGWADKLKLWLHQEMFGDKDKGQVCSVYELGIVGDTARGIVGRFEAETLARITSQDPNDIYIIFSAGTNDSRATNQAGNYLCTPGEFTTSVQAFIRLAIEHSKHVLCVGLLPIDQSKTQPKINPLNDSKSYFTNQRIKQFEDALAQICEKEKVTFLPLFEAAPKDWTEKYLIADGMHPNDAGHEWIFRQVKPKLRDVL